MVRTGEMPATRTWANNLSCKVTAAKEGFGCDFLGDERSKQLVIFQRHLSTDFASSVLICQEIKHSLQVNN